MNALAIRDEIRLDELQTLGAILCKTGFFADAREAGQAVAKILAGRELGFPAIASMTGVYIVKGKVSLSANLIAAAIKRSVKYNYRVKELTSQAAEIEFFEDGESCGVSRFTMVEAKSAGLNDNPTWHKYPRNMLFARAMSNGAKWFTPDIFGGPIYTPDELGATVDGETGDVIDLPVEPTIEPEPEPTTVEAEPTPAAEPTMTHMEAQAELRHLNSKLGYDDAKLLKWLTNKFKLDPGLDIHGALRSLGEGELRDAIETFGKHVKAKGATQ